ncbi:type II toxin-antitoxin system RelE/ParE family toxin [Alkaliphilus pronyensis]|uniref:Type II toxin-antitoxin system RelE/ParE family toxin n=1 Tax=Alkaliphilus pronyensis TaxID=1482732 RepID=A0A6I0F629_9FIRM|nr:type II toxin-antitoxin system RelE/ParE family toxin [Alkaliphilus pronyensis]KAB3532139.1 type II toxin-antitoxin system RelE/ParE family toxin [Alkaliphilus pronyensis]
MIILTKQADNDLRVIYEYIAFTLLEPEITATQLDRIEKSILSIDEMPERFKVIEKEPWYSRGLRQMPVDNFIVFYVSKAEDETVTVIRVMYGGRDIDNQLKNINQ